MRARYVSLSESDKSALEGLRRSSGNHRISIRCHALLLSSEGYRIPQLSEIFKVKKDTIRSWFDRWESEGIAGLKDKPKPGRPPKLSTSNKELVKRVKALVNKESQKLDLVRNQLADEFAVSLSRKTLKRFLKVLVTDGSVLGSHLKSGRIPQNDLRERNA